MSIESTSSTVALGLIALAIVARVGSVQLMANARRRLRLLEQRQIALTKTLLELQGERELLDRSRARATLDRTAALDDVESLRQLLESLRQEEQRRNERIARRIAVEGDGLCLQPTDAAA